MRLVSARVPFYIRQSAALRSPHREETPDVKTVAAKGQDKAPAKRAASKPAVSKAPAAAKGSSSKTAAKSAPAAPSAPKKTMPVASAAPAAMPALIKKDPKLANNWKTKPLEALSDAEIIAMPDVEYMNDIQLAFFRRKLVQQRDAILANADQTAENLRDDTIVVPDPADRATIEEEHSIELRTRDRERKLLKKIEQSIARIDMGDYGYCDETGEPIGVPRLLARPTATLSLEAQQRRELKQKMFGD